MPADYSIFKMSDEERKLRIDEFKSRLNLDNDEARPLAGTDITGWNSHQYVRLAVVSTKGGIKPRVFMCFIESKFLYDSMHDKLNSPDWIREGFDNKWIYIEEVLHKPRPGETLDQYSQVIPEDWIWVAIFEYLLEQGVITRSAQMLKSKTYGLPQD